MEERSFDLKERKIFVGGIARNVSEEMLSTYFSAFGTVLDVKIIMDKQTNSSRG